MNRRKRVVEITKNRTREAPTFANINLLGKCNADCFFCLGKDIKEELSKHNQLLTPYWEWKNFSVFIDLCKEHGVDRLYITGQNADSLQYAYLRDLVKFLHSEGFKVGLRTNGVLALRRMDIINNCELSTGYSIHSLKPEVLETIWGKTPIPDWDSIIPMTNNPRVAVVVTEQTEDEFFDIVKYAAKFPNVKYIQARRISTDTRYDELKPHIEAYERMFELVNDICIRKDDFHLAQVYTMWGKDVLFWRTVETSVNSFNYFTDGTVSDEYFIVEGYMKHKGDEYDE
jgi:MoaA/NifB/PqqE/SkfB family radical SAM enzyme